ncbi:sulfurtransferase complex subunit TusD [Glaciecola sp. MH2013]|uniref:sulfurtransferase complex subunit TusD n=1 Tax=Glaciecola sp. MH2013 TaxID=2785524 RepID=UPI00189C6256|nr:sulfurtransferase complex subunit TusD [Glaciecola sp. MH2013]MBF7072845.1 sulfurtransferase complex subunit TusD [Glaciecola sp. MH2013]
MKHFILMVTKAPFQSENGKMALAFCRAAIEAGHRINQVFFYQEGVFHSSTWLKPVPGELSLINEWEAFSEQTKTPLKLCVSAAERRGLVNENAEMELMHSSFELCGMADYFSEISASKGKLISLQL